MNRYAFPLFLPLWAGNLQGQLALKIEIYMAITQHLMLTGEVSHGTVLAKAMKLCEEAIGKCSWYNISPKYWKKAIAELLT